MGGVSLFAGCTLFSEGAPVPEYIKGAPGVDPLETLEGVKNIYTVCGLCPGNCGTCCRVAQGTLVKIGGNPFNPISTGSPLPFDTPLKDAVAAGGSICAIGGSGIQTLYDPFRVAHPLKRVGPRGSGKWKALTWKQAIAEIIQGGDLFGEGNVKGLKDLKGSSQGLSFMVGRADWGALTFVKRFLASFPGAALVRDKTAFMESATARAADAVFGRGTGPVDADYRSARFLLSFGDAPLDSGVPIVSIAREIADARVKEPGLRWAVVDPRQSTSGAKADRWIPIIPRTDANLALGIMKALAEQSPNGIGYPHESLAKLVSGRTVAEYARDCGLSPDIPAQLARWFAQAGAGSAAVPGRGILAQPDGMETAKLILNLNLMVGSIPGAGGLLARNDRFLKQAEEKLLQGFQRDWEPVGSGGACKALILWGADPVYDDPATTAAFLKSRDKVPLFVALETQITETAALADYILPDTSCLERWDVCVSPPSVAVPGIGVRVPVVGGFETKTGKYFPIFPDTAAMEDILIGLAVALGLPGYGPDAPGGLKNGWDFYRQAVPAVAEAMKEAGLPAPTGNEAAARIFERGGFFAPERPKPSAKAIPPKPEGYEPPALPDRPAEHAESEGLLLITYSLPFHRSPRSGINSWLLEILPENRLLINTQDARRLGIHQRDHLFVESLDNKLSQTCRAHVVPGIRPGVVALAGGFGYGRAGAAPEEIDGRTDRPETVRGAGVNSAAMTEAQPLARVRVRKA